MNKVSIDYLKKKEKKIAALTAYDYSTAKLIDEAGADIILVGDSLAMVALGYPTTHAVTVDEMLVFTGAVSRGTKRALVVADMPFMSYHTDLPTAVKNAGRFIQEAGAQAVKLEGATDYIIEVVKRCCESGIPVLGHLGFTPQYLLTLGGYKIQGKTKEMTLEILKQAKKLEEAGAFGVVLEMMPEEAAKYISENLGIPTIGIGAGRYCSGQILVCDDVFGKYADFTPKFAKKYANLSQQIFDAAKNYIEDVENSKFPTEKEVFHLSEEEKEKL